MKRIWLSLAISALALGLISCGSGGGGGTTNPGSASLVLNLTDAPGTAARTLAAADTCPEVQVQIDGAPADVQTGPDCQLFLSVLPTGDVTVVVSVDGISGTIELTDVVAGEVVEIEVQAGEGSLSIHVLRFEQPVEPLLPTVIDENDVHIELPAGVYDQTLTVNGNGFQLTGEASGDCAEDGWTTITGAVVVQGNNASFTNIKFLGPVTVVGNNVSFSHVCFREQTPDPGRAAGRLG